MSPDETPELISHPANLTSTVWLGVSKFENLHINIQNNEFEWEKSSTTNQQIK